MTTSAAVSSFGLCPNGAGYRYTASGKVFAQDECCKSMRLIGVCLGEDADVIETMTIPSMTPTRRRPTSSPRACRL